MRTILRTLIFVLLSFSAKAQWVEITNLSGTSTFGTLTATVTSGGSVTTWSTWCTTTFFPTSYWAGQSGPGWYTFTLNHPVSALKVYSYALNGGTLGTGEYLEVYLNGAPYSVTAADMTNYNDCGSGSGPVYLYPIGGVNVIMGPTGGGGGYNGGDFIINKCTGINSFELYCNGNEAGVTYYVFVDTVFTCNLATVNTPCLGSALNFNDPGDSTGATYVWYGPAPLTTTVSTSQSFTITPSVWADTGVYHVIKTSGGVHDTASVHVTLNYAPPINGITSLCVGGTTSLTDAVGGTWMSSNTSVATVGASTGVVSGVSAGTSNITFTTAAGCTATTTVTVIVLSAITGTETVCQGSTTTLFDGVGGGTWMSTITGIATIGLTSGVVTGITGGTTKITYTAGSGCYATAIVTVNPTSPISGNLSICQGFTTSLSDGITGGTWYSTNPGVAAINSSGLVSGFTAGTTTISYTAPTGCLMTVVVTVHPTPAAPVVVPPTYCQGSLANALSATPTTGLLWYGPGVTGGTTFAPTPSTASPGVTNYYVTETSTFGCVSDSTIDPVTIIAKPAPPITRDSMYCQYSPTAALNLEVDSAAGSYLNWYSATGGAALGAAPVPPNNVVTYPLGTTWYVSQTVNGCESDKTPIKVTIVYLPNFSILASKSWVCDHDTLTFQYISTTPLVSGTYQWAIPPGSTVVGGSATSTTIQVRFDTVYGAHMIYLTVGELNNMCTTSDTLSVSVIALPSTTAYMKPDICLGDTVTLAVSNESPTASIFTWLVDGTPLANSNELNIVAANSNSGGPYSVSWTDTGTHVITISCTTMQGCKSVPTYDTVDVHALPDALFTYKPKNNSTLCLEDSVLFTANNQAYNCSYLWQPEHFFNNDNKPEIWGKVDAEKSDIVLTVTDPYGCANSTTQQITPASCCTVLFPSAFTPNGDGKNDRYHPLFDGTSYHRFHSFRIVNRWGQTVFESADNTPSWDGNFNGVPQDIGVYYYFIKYDCGGNTIEQKGDLTLIR